MFPARFEFSWRDYRLCLAKTNLYKMVHLKNINFKPVPQFFQCSPITRIGHHPSGGESLASHARSLRKQLCQHITYPLGSMLRQGIFYELFSSKRLCPHTKKWAMKQQIQTWHGRLLWYCICICCMQLLVYAHQMWQVPNKGTLLVSQAPVT